jgi:hypothetical protein
MNPQEMTTMGEKIITVIALLLVTALGGAVTFAGYVLISP